MFSDNFTDPSHFLFLFMSCLIGSSHFLVSHHVLVCPCLPSCPAVFPVLFYYICPVSWYSFALYHIFPFPNIPARPSLDLVPDPGVCPLYVCSGERAKPAAAGSARRGDGSHDHVGQHAQGQWAWGETGRPGEQSWPTNGTGEQKLSERILKSYRLVRSIRHFSYFQECVPANLVCFYFLFLSFLLCKTGRVLLPVFFPLRLPEFKKKKFFSGRPVNTLIMLSDPPQTIV